MKKSLTRVENRHLPLADVGSLTPCPPPPCCDGVCVQVAASEVRALRCGQVFPPAWSDRGDQRPLALPAEGPVQLMLVFIAAGAAILGLN